MSCYPWHPIAYDGRPSDLVTVWLTDGTHVWLGCSFYDEDAGGYLWAVSDGVVYADGEQIVAECEMADIEPTHWHALPTLPKL